MESSAEIEMFKLKELMENMLQSKEHHFKKDPVPLIFLKALIFLGFQKNNSWQRILRAMEDKKSETIEAQIRFLSTQKPFTMHRDVWVRLWFAVYGNFQVSPEDSAIIVHSKKQHHCPLPFMRGFIDKIECMQDETLKCQRDMLFCMAAMQNTEVNDALLGGVYHKLNPDTTFETLNGSLMPLVNTHVNDENLSGVEREIGKILPYLSVAFDECGLGAWETETCKKFYTVEPENYEKVTRGALQQEIKAALREQQTLLQTVDTQKLDLSAMTLCNPEIMAEQQSAKKGQLRLLLKRIKEDIQVLTTNQINEAQYYQQLQTRIKQRSSERKDMMEQLNWERIHTSNDDSINGLVRWSVPQTQGASLTTLTTILASIDQNMERLQPFRIAQRSG
jgi:hypothetical protein